MHSTSLSSQNLAILLLGQPEIRLDGVSIQDRFQSKVLALLTYLAAEPRRHSREHLIDLFWPEVDVETARANLRVNLYRLRQALGDDRYLRVSREALSLAPEACRVDIAGFLEPGGQEATVEQLETRAALYRGTFFEGMGLENCADFSDWLALKREACHRQALALLDRVIALCEQNGEIGRALVHAGRRLELEPWSEDAHRRRMALLAQDGQQAAALAQYDACRKMLAGELGVAPDPQTEALYQRIKAGKLAPKIARQRPFSFLGQTASATLSRPLNVLVVDDHLLFRAGLNLMLGELGPDVTVFETASCEEALALAEPQAGFDIILLDLKFPGMSGLDGLVLFRNRYPDVPVVVFSSDEETSVIQASHERGARGYLSKGMEAGVIVKAIEQVLSGGVAFPFELAGGDQGS